MGDCILLQTRDICTPQHTHWLTTLPDVLKPQLMPTQRHRRLPRGDESLKLGFDFKSSIPEINSLREMGGAFCIKFWSLGCISLLVQQIIISFNKLLCWKLPWSLFSLLQGLFYFIFNSMGLWQLTGYKPKDILHPWWTCGTGMWLGVTR